MGSLRDVAKRANVAVSTASAALNGTRPVAAETKRRVKAAAAELGYRPNVLARGLVSKRTRILALHYPAPASGFGLTEMQFATGAAAAASELGYHLLLSPENADPLEELRYLTGTGLLDGVLLMEVRLDDERVALLTGENVPFALIGRTRHPDELWFADIDFARLGTDVVEHLTGLGHRAMAFINHTRDAYTGEYGPVVRIGEEIAAAAKEAGMSYADGFDADTAEQGRAAFDELMRTHPETTAVAVFSDQAVVGVLAAVEGQKKRVPDDLTVLMVLTSAQVAAMFRPRLTTLEPPSLELGRRGAQMLIEQLADDTAGPPPGGELVPCRLVVGDSSAAPRTDPKEVGA
ncbi:DNA-binding LacI/PurR family transcriptional regulator [Catenuloplanes nepalensis]|uniref:DNA-binding LacI/PurR family transcriptional regulator n=1 Tax=Catenuloplanes nepalensis TaxID=587533 RepID=A0ABT9MUS1_9ACTN|nr:LacI family DNA-binding transcriptional regulator [Catenuloplanes nepalensis]MDP9795192.1 DNA-binding LacI/PurR family transcriptional regulator [Catenuloplanes nepalensis]